jgi:hypothetical protein
MGKIFVEDSYDYLTERLKDIKQSPSEAPILFPKTNKASTAKAPASANGKNSKSSGSKSR